MPAPAFDSLAALYDLFQNWESRLPREIEVLDRILAKEGAVRVLDAACGTGVHLSALRDLGYEVTGTDLSPEMVERAAQRVSRVHVADFTGAHRLVRDQDAVLVLGNSLPNAGGPRAVRRAVKGLGKCLRPGGLLVLHVLNYPKLIASGGGLGPVRRVVADGREYLFLKLFEIHRKRVVLNVIALVREAEGFERHLLRTELCPVTQESLTAALLRAGLELEECRAGFSPDPFDEKTSADLLLIARRTGDRK